MAVLLVGINAKYIHSNLAIRYLAKAEKRFRFCEYSISDREESIAASLYQSGCRTFLFSCYIWNINHVLKICEILKKADAGLRLLVGGPEVSFDPVESLESYPYLDGVITGEGEVSITPLADAIENGDFSQVPGLYYRTGESVIKSKIEAGEANLSCLPFPYADEDMEALRHRIVYFETSRGCPYRCAFCLSGSAGSLRFLPLEKVERAVRFFARHEVPLVKLVDRTFNADPNRALLIIEMIKKMGGNTTYHFEIRAESMTEALIESLQTAPKGMFQLEIGVQSVNPATLQKVNRVPSHEKLCRVVQALKKNDNIHLHLDLIAGLPGESFKAFVYSFHELMKLKPHNLQLGFLKKLKGSALAAEGSAFASFAPYEVIHSDAMSYAELLRLKAAEDMLERFYNSGAFLTSVPYMLDTYYKEKEFYFFDELAQYFSNNQGTLSQKSLFEGLHHFAQQKFADSIMDERLIYDYALKHRDSLSFMPRIEGLKELAFAFLKEESLVRRYFEQYAGIKPVLLYKKLHFVPVGKHIYAIDYEGEGHAYDITEACKTLKEHMVN
ncbi:MAG: DUF4080 domain-containing protein [Ruminococcaceae bacterium]|nr:DUF4080 domain-containing protein [Oscillospiraceae bacterium]